MKVSVMSKTATPQSDLCKVNECLVVATMKAQAVAEAAKQGMEHQTYRAEHDFLTGLPNRSLLTDRLAQAIASGERTGKKVALMYLDLDSFKQINDALGHSIGDQLLQSVAGRLQTTIRHSDTVTISRHGGDEFVVLLPEVEAIQDVEAIAKKLIETMAEPHLLDGHRIQVTLSIGISLYPDHGKDVDQIVRNADTAMYHAKLCGRNNFQIFTPEMSPAGSTRQRLEEFKKRVVQVQPQSQSPPGAIPAERAARRESPSKAPDTPGPAPVSKAQLVEANQCLVVATVDAQRMAEAAEQTVTQMAYQAKLEARLVEAQKLETLGVLAGGVAHDFNNLLTTIFGYVDIGRLASAKGKDMKGIFDSIEKAAARAGDLTHQLLAYAGKGVLETTEVDLTLLVKEVTGLLSVSIPKTVTVQCDQGDRLPYVKGDSTQILQILMNLITNASEAFPEGAQGRITVRTRSEAIDEAAIKEDSWILPAAPGPYATLEVEDTGFGMAPTVLTRIFEPFYTTKAAGHGLGLAAVLGIMRSHGGGLRVRSQPGQRTSIKLYFPALREARSHLIPAFQSSWQGKGRFLIVDSDPAALGVARHMAESHGFTVTEAPNGPAAVEIFQHSHGDLAMVLMDLKFPRKAGREAFNAMQKIDTSVPMISSSRYNERDADGVVKGLAGFLKKPYRMAEFQGVVQRTLTLWKSTRMR